MLRIIFGLIAVLHGLVHMWYFTLSQNLVTFEQDMGWSGRSWLFSGRLGDAPVRWLASGLYVLATVAYVVSGIGVVADARWWRPVLVGSAVLSSVVIILYWDGRMQQLVEKGLVGLVFNAAFLIAVLWLNWPAEAL